MEWNFRENAYNFMIYKYCFHINAETLYLWILYYAIILSAAYLLTHYAFKLLLLILYEHFSVKIYSQLSCLWFSFTESSGALLFNINKCKLSAVGRNLDTHTQIYTHIYKKISIYIFLN